MRNRAIGACGIAAVLLFAAGNALWAFDQPDPGAPPGELIVFYTDNGDGIIAGGGISLLAIAVLVVFASGLRRVLIDASGDDVLPTAALGGALLGLAAGLAAETLNMVGAARADDGLLSPDLAQSLFEISYVLGYNGAGLGLGLFAICTALVALQQRVVLPRWLAVLLLAAGLALLSPLVELAFFAFPLLAVVAAYVMRIPDERAG